MEKKSAVDYYRLDHQPPPLIKSGKAQSGLEPATFTGEELLRAPTHTGADHPDNITPRAFFDAYNSMSIQDSTTSTKEDFKL